MNTVSPEAIERIRDLSRRVAEAASHPGQREKIDLWKRKNALEHVRPMVLIFPEGSWEEVTADWEYATEGGLARTLEHDLLVRLCYAEQLRDDGVVEAVVVNPTVVHSTGYGFEEARSEPSQHKGAYRIEPVLVEESDARRITAPVVRVDREATRRNAEYLQSLLDGILPVETRLGGAGSFGPMDTLAKWRGIEQLFLDLVERPGWVHEVVSRMLEAKLSELRQLQEQDALTLNNGGTYNGSGGFGWTRELPREDFDGAHVRPRDLWGYARAQIFCRVSPAMHEEFSLRYERPFLECFGLSSYGCCEPLHDRLELLKTITNLRVISISPWADVARSAESLGDRYVFSWKPNPAVMAAAAWDPEGIRGGIRDFLAKTRGCITQIVMKDVHTTAREPRRLGEWVRIAREEVVREVEAHG